MSTKAKAKLQTNTFLHTVKFLRRL